VIIIISFNELIYFEAIVRLGSITAASKELYISQQGISKSIKKLENYLGAPLFNRSRIGITLTEYGKEFYPIVLDVLKEYNFLLNKALYSSDNQTINILYQPEVAFLEITIHRSINYLKKFYPQCQYIITPFDNIHDTPPNKYDFFCYNQFMLKTTPTLSNAIKNLSTITCYNDIYCLVFNKTLNAHQNISFPLHIPKLISLSTEYQDIFPHIGITFDKIIVSNYSISDIISYLLNHPEYVAFVPNILLKSFPTILENFEIVTLDESFSIKSFISYNRQKTINLPILQEFLNTFLKQIQPS